MADDEETEQPEVAKKKTSPMVALLVLAVAGVGGFFTGTSVLAPRVISGASGGVVAGGAETNGGADNGQGESVGDGYAEASEVSRTGEEGHFVELGNILVNPRDSRGLRFLMATVALELEDASTRTNVLQREVHARDVIISVLERHTLEELAATGGRDSVRVEIRRELLEAFRLNWLIVYIPQYVIN